MKSKTSHPILITIIIILSVSFCAALFTVVSQNFRTPVAEIPTEPDPPAIPGDTKPYNFDYSWLSHPYVAHAMGAIDGNTYTNSYEAFLSNYQLGHRVFEVDLSLTDDNEIVLAHDADQWHKDATVQLSNTENLPNSIASTFTYDNFMSSLWYDKYHSLDLKSLFYLMQAYPDIYIITDSKYTDKTTVRSEFDEIVKLALSIDESLLDRLVIQIYHPEMLDWIMEIHPWKSVIYTLYANPDWTPENVLAFSQESGVKFITLWHYLITPEIISLWNTAYIKIGAHTINHLATARHLRTIGTDIIYTDYLLPYTLAE